MRDVSLFELQTLLNNLAEKFSKSIVKHAFVDLRSIMKVAKKLKVLADNPSEDLEMPVTRTIEKPTITPEEINSLLDAIEDPHDRRLTAIGRFCATRPSETFGLKWKAYRGRG